MQLNSTYRRDDVLQFTRTNWQIPVERVRNTSFQWEEQRINPRDHVQGAMKEYRARRGTAAFNLGTRWKASGQLRAPAALPPGKNPGTT